jgi:GABA permease
MTASPELHKKLKPRQLTMIAIGGVIGAGLFVGSGVVINDAGPGAFLSYGVTGVLIILVMRMLGEMATANPTTGSFADYARKALGGWAGFSVGWLYWYFWVIVVGFEAVAGAKVLSYWIDAPLWLLSLTLMTLMTCTNLFSVSSFGEFEFWFAGIKVVAIIAFLVLGGFFVLGFWPNKSLDFSNLVVHDGFFPHGPGAIFSAIVVVIFSMVGAEVATIAAAETEDPARSITKAMKSVVLRISLFFVGSLFLLAVIVPWDSTELGASPFVTAFTVMGIPFADTIMNAVVLTAVLSCLNSGLYTSSRMLFVLAARREAPQALTRVSKRGVPMTAILASSVIGFLCVIAAAISPDGVFLFLLNSSGAIILFVYLLIALSQIILRRRTDPEKLHVKMWLFPGLSIVTAVAIAAVLVQMAVTPNTQISLALSSLSWAIVVVIYFVVRRRGGSIELPDASTTGSPQRILVMADQAVSADELLKELYRLDENLDAQFFVCVPATPNTGQTETAGMSSKWEPATADAQRRLAYTIEALRLRNVDVAGELADYRPLRALASAVANFKPDQLVISTLPEPDSAWLRYDVIDRIRSTYPIPVTHIVSKTVATA